MKTKEKKDLVQIIRDNPGCRAVIDNDCWWLEKDSPEPDGFDDWTEEAREEWFESQKLASSSDRLMLLRGCTYGSEDCYGGAILLALAEIVGIQVESV